MLKLYRQQGAELQYWEAWHDGGAVLVHAGVVGTRGVSKKRALNPGEDAEKIIRQLAKPFEDEGFSRRKPEILIVVQFRVEGMGTVADLELRHRLEDEFANALGWTGNGDCDGGDMGLSGSINIYCYVHDVAAAVAVLLEALRKQGLEGRAVIASEDREDGEYTVRWPADYAGEFGLF